MATREVYDPEYDAWRFEDDALAPDWYARLAAGPPEGTGDNPFSDLYDGPSNQPPPTPEVGPPSTPHYIPPNVGVDIPQPPQPRYDEGARQGDPAPSTPPSSGGSEPSPYQQIAPPPAVANPTVEAYRKKIGEYVQRLLDRGFSPVSGDDPSIRGQFAPISAQLQRGSQRAREAAAERLAFQGANVGGAGGALDAEVNKILEDVGFQEGQLLSELITKELEGRRADVMAALQFAQGEERLALQEQLANLDAAIRRESLGMQDRHFYDELGFRIGVDEADRNERAARDLLD